MSIIIISCLSCLLFAPVIGMVATNYSIVSGNFTARWAQSPKPLLGGISMFIAILTAITFGGIPFADHPVLSCAALFTAIGIADDIFALTPGKKILLQILAAIVSAKFFLLLPFSPWFVLVVFWIVVFVNAFNLIDGMDGLAVSYAILIFTWIALLGNPHIFSYAILGVCLGFLPYNFRNASLYLGDSGSQFLGSAIAVLVLPSQLSTVGISSWHPSDVLPLLFPIGDIIFVAITRKIRGISIKTGGTDHTAHRLARLIGEKNTVILISGVTIFFIFISLLCQFSDWHGQYVGISIIIGYVLSIIFLQRKTKKYFLPQT